MNEYDALVSEGREVVRGMEGAQWTLGDLALTVETVHGEHTLERYAGDIGVAARTLENYRYCAKQYESPFRKGNLSHLHHYVICHRPDRLEWLKKAEAEKWSVRDMLDAIRTEEAKARRAEPSPQQRIQEHIQQGASAEEAVTRQVQTHGPPTPATARLIAQETHVPVLASDNRVYDDRPQEVIERSAAHVQRQQSLIRALRTIAHEMASPEEEARDFADHNRQQLEAVLGPALDWLTHFNEEWRNRWLHQS